MATTTDLSDLLRAVAQNPKDRQLHLAVADFLLELDGPYAAFDSAAWSTELSTAHPPIVTLDPVEVAQWTSQPFAGLRDAAIANGDRHVYHSGVLYIWPKL